MRLYNVRFIIARIIIGIFYWFIEGLIHYFFFDFEGHLVEDLFSPTLHELYMRLIIFGLLVLFGIYSNKISRKRAQDVTYTERQRLYTILDNLPALVYLQAFDYSIRYANRYFREKFGSSDNKKCYEILFNRNQPCNECHISRIFVKKTPFEGELEFPNGKSYQLYCYPFEDDTKELLALSLGIDITEKKEAENLIKDELNKLNQLDQIKNDLIRRISHEIKTPLISIYSTSNLILNVYKEELSSKTLNFITMINEGGERLKELVDNMLDVYNIESNNIKLNFKTHNLVDILEMSIRTVQSQIVKRQHKVEINLPQEVYMDVDYDRIKQVFLNLLINALKYTPPGGKIFVQLQEDNSHIDITIKDIGVGFTEQEKEKIFKKFGKIERYGKGMNVDTEGAGFGLYIAKKLTQQHNGELILKSEGRNKGSMFIVRLFKENYK